MTHPKLFVSLLLLAGALSTNVASAQHGHHHSGARVGIYVNPWPLYYPGPRYYPYNPYYYDYPLVVTQPAPTVYVERGPAPVNTPPEASQAAPASGDWYYCHNPDGYYPYIKNCPAGWERVPAQPAPQR